MKRLSWRVVGGRPIHWANKVSIQPPTRPASELIMHLTSQTKPNKQLQAHAGAVPPPALAKLIASSFVPQKVNTKISNTLVGMGSAALAVAVAVPMQRDLNFLQGIL